MSCKKPHVTRILIGGHFRTWAQQKDATFRITCTGIYFDLTLIPRNPQKLPSWWLHYGWAMRCARMMSIWWRCAWPSPHRGGVGQTALRESLRPRSIRLPRRLAACPPSGRVVVRRRARPVRAAAMMHRSAWNHLLASYGGSLGSQALTRSSRMRRQPKSR